MELITHSKPWITDSDIIEVKEIMSSGMITRGARSQAFEGAVAGYNATPGSVSVGSGTAALMLTLKALKIGPGDEVILPTYVCVSVANAVKAVGAMPVLCDVGDHWNMTPQSVEPHISKKTKALIVVHIFGIVADTKAFLHFNIPVIEDCCQAFGASTKGLKVGTVGAAGIFSFNAIKCLTTGEGGAVTSMDAALLDRIRVLRLTNAVPSPMTDMQAALGLSQLARYDEMLMRRKNIAEKYFKLLSNNLTNRLSEVKRDSIFFRFPVVISDDFEALRQHFESKGIAVRKGVDALIHRQYGMPDENFPIAAKLFNTTLSLPIYPALKDAELDHILHEAGQLWPR